MLPATFVLLSGQARRLDDDANNAQQVTDSTKSSVIQDPSCLNNEDATDVARKRMPWHTRAARTSPTQAAPEANLPFEPAARLQCDADPTSGFNPGRPS